MSGPQIARLGDVELEYALAGDGPELVWCHGLGQNLETERRLAEALVRDHRVLWYSSRGHGRSTPVQTADDCGYAVFARDLDRLLDHLGFDRPLLAGGSHGASTVLRHALDVPGRGRALLLVAPGANTLERPEPERLALERHRISYLVDRPTGTGPGVDTTPPYRLGAPEPVPASGAELVAAVSRCDVVGLAHTMRTVPDQAAVDAPRLTAVAVPTHVIAWDGDVVLHPLAVAQALVELIPGATLQVIERPVQALPAEIAVLGAELIRDWASQQGSPASALSR